MQQKLYQHVKRREKQDLANTNVPGRRKLLVNGQLQAK